MAGEHHNERQQFVAKAQTGKEKSKIERGGRKVERRIIKSLSRPRMSRGRLISTPPEGASGAD